MQFSLGVTERRCYLGHVDVFEIEGTDTQSREWLEDWDLWCRTCQALVSDEDQAAFLPDRPLKKDAVGYVISVPVALVIVEGEPRRTARKVFSGDSRLRAWQRLLRKGGNDHGS